MAETQIRVGGFGGQGVILSGIVIGRAAAIHGGLHAVMTQSFGPEARGSACSAQVVISDDRVLYPYVVLPRIMIAMSQDGYASHKNNLAKDGLLVYENELVKVDKMGPQVKAFGIPATRIAEELGRKIILNIVMLGFFGGMADILPREALRQAVKDSVPPGTEDVNLKAFDRGYEYALEIKEKAAVKA